MHSLTHSPLTLPPLRLGSRKQSCEAGASSTNAANNSCCRMVV